MTGMSTLEQAVAMPQSRLSPRKSLVQAEKDSRRTAPDLGFASVVGQDLALCSQFDRAPLARQHEPDVAFCGDNLLARGFIDVARHEFGLCVPDYPWVIGFDDMTWRAVPAASP